MMTVKEASIFELRFIDANNIYCSTDFVLMDLIFPIQKYRKYASVFISISLGVLWWSDVQFPIFHFLFYL
jgi:hypothetical protein